MAAIIAPAAETPRPGRNSRLRRTERMAGGDGKLVISFIYLQLASIRSPVKPSPASAAFRKYRDNSADIGKKVVCTVFIENKAIAKRRVPDI
jgi:hypothetical protein